MSRMHEAFAAAHADGRAALIGYLPAGFPTKQESIELIAAMVDGGVDIVEVGLPYSDPLMDGPAIQQAAGQALAAGATTDTVLEVVAATAKTGAVPLVMSYWNPIEKYGVERFAEGLSEAGGTGVITPDLTPEEAGAWTAATDANGIDRIFMIAPSSTDARTALVSQATTGFVYAASTMGVTGARTTMSTSTPELVARIRRTTNLPVAVGIGVSTGSQAADVASYADGVIVGSAFIALILGSTSHDDACAKVNALARELSAGCREGRNR